MVTVTTIAGTMTVLRLLPARGFSAWSHAVDLLVTESSVAMQVCTGHPRAQLLVTTVHRSRTTLHCLTNDARAPMPHWKTIGASPCCSIVIPVIAGNRAGIL